jgi:hypothetical protein
MARCLSRILFDNCPASSGSLHLLADLLKTNPQICTDSGTNIDLAGLILSREHGVESGQQMEQLIHLLFKFCELNVERMVPAGWHKLQLLVNLRQAVREPTTNTLKIPPLGIEEGNFLLNIELSITKVSFLQLSSNHHISVVIKCKKLYLYCILG